MFWQGDDPVFPTEFSGTSPYAANNWHGAIHGVPRIYDNTASQAAATDLSASFGHYAKTFTSLVQRLASFIEVDGSRMLDNTLVLWVSEMGYGAVHSAANLPVVLAGMASAFPKGQGRHVIANRRSMGDLLAHSARLLGGTDTTFGETGTLGSRNRVRRRPWLARLRHQGHPAPLWADRSLSAFLAWIEPQGCTRAEAAPPPKTGERPVERIRRTSGSAIKRSRWEIRSSTSQRRW